VGDVLFGAKPPESSASPESDAPPRQSRSPPSKSEVATAPRGEVPAGRLFLFVIVQTEKEAKGHVPKKQKVEAVLQHTVQTPESFVSPSQHLEHNEDEGTDFWWLCTEG